MKREYINMILSHKWHPMRFSQSYRLPFCGQKVRGSYKITDERPDIKDICTKCLSVIAKEGVNE